MSAPDGPTPREVEELATLLDAASTPGGGPAADASSLAATVAAVHGGDRPAVPSPAFRASLKEHVMRSAAPFSLTPAPNGRQPHPAAFAPTLVRPRTAHGPASAGSRRRGVIEFVSLAALIAVIFAQAMGAGGNLAFWRQEATPVPSSGEVGMERGNAARTGEYAAIGPEVAPALAWRIDSLAVNAGEGSLQFLPPVLAGGNVFALNGFEGKVYRFSADDGRRWSLSGSLGYVEGSNLTVSVDAIYVATAGPNGVGADPGYLISLDRSTFEERWRVKTGGVSNAALVVDGDRLYAMTVDGAAVAYDTSDGREVWRTPIDVAPAAGDAAVSPDPWYARSIFAPAVADGAVYLSAGNRTLTALDAASGEVRWTFTAETARLGTPAVRDGSVYVVARDGGERQRLGEGALYRVDAATGAEVWRWALPEWGAAASTTGSEPDYPAALTVTVDHDHAYVLDAGVDGNEVTAIAVGDGSVVWTVAMPRAGGSAPVVAGDTLYLARQDGGIYALDAGDGSQRWRLDTGRRFLRSPVVADGRLVAMTADGELFGIGEAGGATTPVAAATGTPDNPSDISGLAPCVPPRAFPDPLPSGEPTIPRLIDTLGIRAVNGVAAIADLPTAPAADGDAVLGILATLRALPGCDRPGRERDLAAFYSDDFLRRTALAYGPDALLSVAGMPYSTSSASLLTLPEPVALPDDRVGLLLVNATSDSGSMLVFVEQDGHWLIDEVISAAKDPSSIRG